MREHVSEQGTVVQGIERALLSHDERDEGKRHAAMLGGNAHAHHGVATARNPVLEPRVAVDERMGAEPEQVEELALEQVRNAEAGGEDAGPRSGAVAPVSGLVRSWSRRAGR